MSKVPFCLDTSPLDETMQELARTELRETPEVREAAIIELRRLLHQNTDLHYRDDDDFLLIFLRPCHFYPESAIKMVSCARCKRTHLQRTTRHSYRWVSGLCSTSPLTNACIMSNANKR